MKAMDTAMNHTSVQEEKHIDFIQRVKARRQLMKQAAEDLIKELGLPIESKYDVMSIIYRSPSVEQAIEKEATKAIEPQGIPARMLGTLPYNDDNVDSILAQLDGFIVAVACNTVPRNAILPELLEDEIDELAQTIRIKLWRTLRSRHIMSPKSYIRAIARSESIRAIYRLRASVPLPLDQEGELYQGQVLTTPSEGMQDPADEIEQKETTADIIADAVSAVVSLPPLQQQAMICALKDQIEDVLTLIVAFRRYEVDIEKIQWPENKADTHRLKASLSIARKKLYYLVR
jgi:hypothetical protein